MITPFLLYLLKANIALTVFYLFYRLFLRRETFYTCNRTYFLLAAVLVALFPLVDFSMFFPAARPFIIMPEITPLIDTELTGRAHRLMPGDYVAIALLVGSGILVIRLFIQLASLLNLHRSSKKELVHNKHVFVIDDKVNPFSFFKWIFLNTKLHDNNDLREIISHENIHVKQGHTFDILLYEAASAFFWYNPFIWFMRRDMKQNIEFLTDRETLRSGYNKRHYQYNLLKVSRIPVISSIVNNFNLNDLKNRIVMMNKQQSSNSHLFKYVLVIPLFVCATLLVNAKAIKDKEDSDEVNNTNIIADDVAIAFDKDIHDFGTIRESDGNKSTIFTFVNTGDTPIVVENVVASCGCTIPEWTKEPVMPGTAGYIRATYDPAGRVYPFNRLLTVQFNVEPYKIALHVKGMVIK